MVLLCTATLWGQTSTSAKSKTKAKAATVSADEVQQLKDALAAQQQRIEQLEQRQAQSDQHWQQQLQQAQAAVAEAQAKAQQATAQAGQQQQAVTDLGAQVSDLKQNAASAALSLQETEKSMQSSLESPNTIHYRGITFTPGGFLSADTVWRSHALGADANTPFNQIPFSGASQSQMSEFYASGRQSRITLLATGKLNSATIGGYVSADFMSAGSTSNNNSTNSYTLRLRDAYAQAALNSGWTFTGGQMWSLLTETKTGTDNRTEAVPLTIDTKYNAGFTYARQYAFRVAKDLGDKIWLAAAVEESQATLGGRGASNNFLMGQQGNISGSFNPSENYAYNSAPDFILKAAFQPGWGHYEVFGVMRDFRDRVFPCATTSSKGSCDGETGPTAAGAFNNSGFGGGLGVNARGTIAKHVDVGLHFLGGNGIGRYGSSSLSDVIARPDGVLIPLREYQGLGTIEWHSKRFDVYGYGGGEYAGREWFRNGKTQVGYGAPGNALSGCSIETLPASTTVTVVTPPTTTGGATGTATIPVPGSGGIPLTGGFNPGSLSKCSADTRAIIEGTAGFWYRIYVGPKGRIQVGPQYSYVARNAWTGTGGDASGNENMFFTSFRYYLP
jgi:hypothetical protein